MKINFFRCNIPDTEDPVVMMAEPIYQWQQTDQGRWVMANAHDLTWYHQSDMNHWGYDVVICGELRDPHLVTEYFLRWPSQS